MITLSKRSYQGEITPPSSKSDAHRALICASLVEEGVSKISNVYFSNDIKATMHSLESLGASFKIDGNDVYVKGISRNKISPILDVEESGSTLRFLLPLGTHFSSSARFKTAGRLSSRPLDVYQKIFQNQNISFSIEKDLISTQGKLSSGTYHVNGNVSSQFISGLLFLLPLLNGDSKIIIENKISSLSYIYMTIDILNKFNIKIDFNLEKKEIYIKGNQKYQPIEYQVEIDFSQASFFLALGALSSSISVKGLNMDSLQPDRNILPILEKMGVNISYNKDLITTSFSQIKKTTISLDENPDLGPILMALASFSNGDVVFTNISRLRLKESDRIEAMRINLEKLGVHLEIVDEDTCIVHPSKLIQPKEVLSSFNDHRIFMSLVIITKDLEVTLDDQDCINKSYPTFLEDLKKLEKEEAYE